MATTPVWESYTSNGSSAATSLGVSVPSGSTTGDLILLLCFSDSTIATATATGFTEVCKIVGSGVASTILWRAWQSGDSTYTAAQTDNRDFYVMAVRISGVDLSDPIVDFGTNIQTSAIATFTSTNIGLATPAGVTNALIVGMFSYDGGDSGTPAFSGSAGGYTMQNAGVNSTGTAGLSYAAISYRILTASTNQTSVSVTTASALSDGWAKAGVLLRPTGLPIYITPSGIANASGIGAPVLHQGITGTGIASTTLIGSHSVNNQVTLWPTGLPAQTYFGGARITFEILCTGIAAGTFVASPTLSLGLESTGIPGNEAFGTATVATALGDIIAPAGIDATAALGGISLSYVMYLDGLAGSTTFGSPGIGLGLDLTTIAPNTLFGAPAIYPTITPAGIASLTDFGVMIIDQGVSRIYPEGIGPHTGVGYSDISGGLQWGEWYFTTDDVTHPVAQKTTDRE